VILITGATGNIGRELVPLLMEKGERVCVLVRDEGKAASLFGKADLVIGDLDRPETLPPAMQGVDKLFLVTPDTKQVTHLLKAAKAAGVKHVVKVSTIEADRSLGPGKWHRQQEELIKSTGLAWTMLRPTMMMVNTIEWWGETIKSQNAVYFPGGSGRVSPVDARDVARVAFAVLTESCHEGKVYELTGPQSLTIGEMVETLASVLKKPIQYRDVPVFAAAIGMLRFRLPLYLVMGLMQTLGALRRSEYAYVTDVVEQVGKCKPRTFEEWCHENMEFFQ
jgi:uncharacterized protein YbjT (DUF2867 family)